MSGGGPAGRPFSSLPYGTAPEERQHIETKTFVSTNLRVGAYDERDQSMTITFQDGRSYEYRNVPQGIWEGLKAAGSPGTYFHRQIRGRYAGSET